MPDNSQGEKDNDAPRRDNYSTQLLEGARKATEDYNKIYLAVVSALFIFSANLFVKTDSLTLPLSGRMMMFISMIFLSISIMVMLISLILSARYHQELDEKYLGGAINLQDIWLRYKQTLRCLLYLSFGSFLIGFIVLIVSIGIILLS